MPPETKTCSCQSFGYPCIDSVPRDAAAVMVELRLKELFIVTVKVPIGGGSTVAKLLAPLFVLECKKAVLFVRPAARKYLGNMYERIRQHFTVPSLVMESEGFFVPGETTLIVLPVARLSRPEGVSLLADINPDLVMFDEQDIKLGSESFSRISRYVVTDPTPGQKRLIRWGS